jgi:hypothetical protein
MLVSAVLQGTVMSRSGHSILPSGFQVIVQGQSFMPRACLCRQRIYPHLRVGTYPPMSPSGARIERRSEWNAVCWPLAWVLRYVPRFLVVAGTWQRRAVAACQGQGQGQGHALYPQHPQLASRVVRRRCNPRQSVL